MLKAVFNGIKAYFGAFGLLSKLKLWKYFAIPIMISIVTAILFITLAYFLASPIGNFIANAWVWEWGSETFTTISKFIGGFIVLILGLILYKHIVLALSAPFMSPVSEKIEAHFRGDKVYKHRKTSFGEQLMRGIRINVRNLIKELLYIIPLLLLGIIPGVGIITTILIFVIQAYYVGFGNMDYTMERHFSYKESIAFVKKNRGTAIGNGIIFVLMLFIPVIGIIVTLPIAVVAASTETISILKEEELLTVVADIKPVPHSIDKQ